jgi:hypothetical protein
MKKIVVQIETSKTKADKIELSQELKAALKIPTDNHLVSEGILKATGLKEIFENGKGNIEGYINKKGGILPDSGFEFMRWLATAHPELRDTPCKNIRLNREYFFEFSEYTENQRESAEPESVQPNHPKHHPFPDEDVYNIFKFLSENYDCELKKRWSYIYIFLSVNDIIDYKITSASGYLRWVKEHYEDISTNLQGGDPIEKKKLEKILESYRKDPI